MKLNMECVRDVLLELESRDYVREDDDIFCFIGISLNDLCKQLSKWERTDIFYSLFNLDQADYISMTTFEADIGICDCIINYITFDGHEFLESVRDSQNWKKVKSGLSAVRNYSLSAIAALAEGITSAAVDKFLSRNVQ